MIKEIDIALIGSSVIFAFIGLFFVFKIWMVWKHVDKDVLKARVFLNDDFLIKNWLYVFLAGAFIAGRRAVELAELLELRLPGGTFLFNLMGVAAIVLLVLLAYHWYLLIYSTIPSPKATSSPDIG